MYVCVFSAVAWGGAGVGGGGGGGGGGVARPPRPPPPKKGQHLFPNVQKKNSNNVSILLDSASLISTLVILYWFS